VTKSTQNQKITLFFFCVCVCGKQHRFKQKKSLNQGGFTIKHRRKKMSRKWHWEEKILGNRNCKWELRFFKKLGGGKCVFLRNSDFS